VTATPKANDDSLQDDSVFHRKCHRSHASYRAEIQGSVTTRKHPLRTAQY